MSVYVCVCMCVYVCVSVSVYVCLYVCVCVCVGTRCVRGGGGLGGYTSLIASLLYISGGLVHTPKTNPFWYC